MGQRPTVNRLVNMQRLKVLSFAAVAMLMLNPAYAAESVLKKPYKVGDLIRLSATDSVGWDIESGASTIQYEVNDDQTEFFAGTGPVPTTFVVKASSVKTLKNGKTVPHVVQKYLIEITQGDAPGPGPGPTPIPNKLGVGKIAYDQAKAINEPEVAVQLYRIWGWAAIAMKEATTYEAQQEVFKAKVHDLSNQCCSAKWDTFRNALQVRFNELQDAGVIKPGDVPSLVAAMEEVAAALKVLVGK